MSLRSRIDVLCLAFVADVSAALRSLPLEEIMAAGSGQNPPPRPLRTPKKLVEVAAKKPVEAVAKKRAKAPSKPKSSVGRATRDAELTFAAARFFEERGPKGATEAQLHEHLASSGLTAASDLASSLVARGIIRDSAMRRATGKGTSAVYVVNQVSA